MQTLMTLITLYGLWLVFANVLIEQAGAPIPAYPVLILTAALAVDAGEPLWPIVLLAVIAALIADGLWYWAGRRVGPRVLRIVCRLSLSPDSCISMTRNLYQRWGAPSLMVAKFIPGFASVATTLAGEGRMPLPRFVLFDGLGALLWAGVAVLLGALFHNAINEVLLTLEQLGRIGVALLLVALLAFIASKWWQRQRFLKEIRMARISVPELRELIDSGQPLTLLDVRPSAHRERDGWILGAQPVSDVAELNGEAAGEVIIYCSCPNEASAAMLARQLKARGYSRVRPLAGGLDAWRAEGLPVQRMDQLQ